MTNNRCGLEMLEQYWFCWSHCMTFRRVLWKPLTSFSHGSTAVVRHRGSFPPGVIVRSLTSIQQATGKRFQSFTGQLQRHSTRQRRQSNHSFVTEHIKTTASVSYDNIPPFLKKIITLFFSYSHLTVLPILAYGHKSNSSSGFKTSPNGLWCKSFLIKRVSQ